MADQEDINLAQKLLDLEEQSKGNKEKEIEYAKELEKLKAKQIEQLLAEGKLTETEGEEESVEEFGDEELELDDEATRIKRANQDIQHHIICTSCR